MKCFRNKIMSVVMMMMSGAVFTSCATFRSQKAVIELGGNPVIPGIIRLRTTR